MNHFGRLMLVWWMSGLHVSLLHLSLSQLPISVCTGALILRDAVSLDRLMVSMLISLESFVL